MTSDGFFRILFGLIGLILAIIAIRNLVTGRTWLDGRSVERAEDPRTYWAAVGGKVVFALASLLAILATEQAMVWAVGFGVFGSKLVEFVVSGQVQRTGGRVWSRADGDRAYWVWLAGTIVMTALSVFILVTIQFPFRTS